MTTTRAALEKVRKKGSSGSDPGSGRRRSRWPLFLSIGMVAGVIALYFFSSDFQAWAREAWGVLMGGDEERIETWVKQYGWWGPALIVTLMVVQMFLVVAPTWALMVVAVLAYGPWWGVPLCVVAVLCASTVGYWVGTALNGVTVDRMVGEKNRRVLEEVIDRHGFIAVVLFRVSPILSNDAISFIAGLVRMGYVRYILATLVGIVPLALLIGVVDHHLEAYRWVLVVASALCLLAYLPYVGYRRGWFGDAPARK